jgi:hypothetical protein
MRAQSEKRIEHPMKKDGLLIIDLLMRGTVDEDVYEVLREKKVESRSFSRALWSKILQRMTNDTPAVISQKVQRIFPGQMD